MNNTIIIGGGIIGLSVGWQLLKKGHHVEILEREKQGGLTSYVSAGLLAPQAEMGFEEIELFNYCRYSLGLYPKLIDELKQETGIDVILDRCGTLMTAFDRDDNEWLRRLFNFREKVGLPVQWITGTEAREIEPYLSPKCVSAIWIPADAQIDHRKLLEALKAAFLKYGGKYYEEHNVERININAKHIQSVHVHGNDIKADNVIVCAGSWSKLIEGLPENLKPPVRPVKGQIISLKKDESCNLKHAIRAPDVYLVPKPDGRLLVGATVEEMGYDMQPTAGEIYRLLERGWETVPSIYDLKILALEVGLRPGSRDHMPIIGNCEIEGLYFATGHYRNGILLTPATAYDLSEHIATGKVPEQMGYFNISRFY
jgi:glycine oxidase